MFLKLSELSSVEGTRYGSPKILNYDLFGKSPGVCYVVKTFSRFIFVASKNESKMLEFHTPGLFLFGK